MAVIQLFNKDTKFIDILTGCIPGVVVWLFSRWSEGAIGEGDAFVIGGLGMVIGWRMVCSVCFTACLLCASVAVYLLLGRKDGKRMELPFMPFSGCSLFDELLVNRKDFLVLREGDAVNRQYKGSMTVEAAVVVPMVIFILAAVIYLCFFSFMTGLFCKATV